MQGEIRGSIYIEAKVLTFFNQFSREDSTKEFFDNERRIKRRIRNGRKKIRTTLPDPDKARLLREATELNAVYPGIIKILKVNKPEWLMLAGGSIACIIAGAVMPVFAYFYAEMFAVRERYG